MSRETHRSVLISGASSGIGRALALAYAAPGVHLALIGRDRERLAAVTRQCEAAGATVSVLAEDVRAQAALARWIEAVDDEHPLDLAIAAAGITTGTALGRPREAPEAVRAILSINVTGVLNTVEPAMRRMSTRGEGRLVFIGSLAALRGLPYSPAYCATKAAIHLYAESLRANLAPYGVRVSLVVPGFVATPLNSDMRCPKPFAIQADDAARRIQRGLARGADRIVFPRILHYGILASRLLPSRWFDAILRRAVVDIPETTERDRGGSDQEPAPGAGPPS